MVGQLKSSKPLNPFLIVVPVLLLGVLGFASWQSGTFNNPGFMPHGHCYLWTPSLMWTMLSSDILIGLAYGSISICLYLLVRRIKLPFSAMFIAFGTFIAACGATHFMEVYTLWYPNYWLAALLKTITAVASVTTALLMFPLLPRVVNFAATARLSEERKQQLEAANLELQRREQELLMLNRELEAFSYSVAHDLRTPLRGINGFSQALHEDYGSRLDSQAIEYLDFITNGSQKMGKIIDDLLSLSKVVRQEISKQESDLSLFAQESLESLKASSPDRNVEVIIQKDLHTEGDPGLLRIVVDNLFANAWKFTDRAAAARIEFGKLDQVYFIKDNGAGFDMAYANKLFGAFQRLHSNQEYEGTGIGLATAKRIIARHSGRIWAEGSVGQGATFYFTIGENTHGHN